MANAEMEMFLKLTPVVSDRDVKLYLFLVESYMNTHPGLVIAGNRDDDGYMRYEIKKPYGG